MQRIRIESKPSTPMLLLKERGPESCTLHPTPYTLHPDLSGEETSHHDDGTDMPYGALGSDADCGGGSRRSIVSDKTSRKEDTHNGTLWKVMMTIFLHLVLDLLVAFLACMVLEMWSLSHFWRARVSRFSRKFRAAGGRMFLSGSTRYGSTCRRV